MFDANLRGIPPNEYVFITVIYCEKDCDLYNKGLRAGQTILARTREGSIDILISEDETIYSSLCDDLEDDQTLIIYAGQYDLSDFINEGQKEQARKYINKYKHILNRY